MDFIVREGESIQNAIDKAHNYGGGRVVLEPGIHRTRTIYLKSFVELHLGSGSRIQGGTCVDDYDDFSDPGFGDYAPENSRKVLIAAANAENIAITGKGEINGAGPAFYDTNVPPEKFFAKPPHPRPRMIQFFNCRNVLFQDASFVDSPGWTFWLIACEDVNIHRISVTGNQQMINNDGIDIDDCRRVAISDCFIRTGDDCIVLRAIRKTPEHHACCEMVSVTNCILDSWCQAIRVGCPSDDTIRDCSFSNIVIKGRGNGININNPKRYLRKGCNGFLDLNNIVFSNMIIESDRVPIWINVEEGIRLRHLGGISFSNVRISSDNPCRLDGCPETFIDDVRFSEIRSKHSVEAGYCRNVFWNQSLINHPDL